MALRPFDRRFFGSDAEITQIGEGAIGGKASGLVLARSLLQSVEHPRELPAAVPRMTVVATGVFDAFVERNRLDEIAAQPDLPDDRVAHACQNASVPAEITGDLRALVEETRTPLAVRSSSMLEDALHHPLAGVYATKMIPNRDHDPATRFRRLTEAIKLVWASTWFASPRRYLRAIGRDLRDEKMAVVIQEVVGRRRNGRFYPDVSGVARSWNFYPTTGGDPKDGAVSLALGLGKTIVDGGLCWTYSPARPAAPPPFASAADRVQATQKRFWAIDMERSLAYDPLRPDEYLVEAGLDEADYDDSLRLVASTYDARSDRLRPGVTGDGPRVIDFAPLLVHGELPLNTLLRKLLESCERETGDAVEIEFAVNAPAREGPARLGFLQVRPMATGGERVRIDRAEMDGPQVLLASRRAIGNGEDDSIRDVIYVRPETFEPRLSRAVAAEVQRLNARLADEGRPYLLIGFGRWGSADPWLGIPVRWDQISGARVIVEAMLQQMNVDASQGAHFFHNVSSFGVKYLAVPHGAAGGVDWAWLDAQPEAESTPHVRHLCLARPLRVRVDGRTGRGVVRRPDA